MTEIPDNEVHEGDVRIVEGKPAEVKDIAGHEAWCEGEHLGFMSGWRTIRELATCELVSRS